MLKPYIKCPDYLVSDQGYIISKKSNKKLKPQTNPDGYSYVILYIGNEKKHVKVHVAVLETFVPNRPPEKTQVNHIDGNKKNNSLMNLEWVTRQENIDHAKNVLGYYPTRANHPNSRRIMAVSQKDPTDKIIFNSLMDAAEYFNKDNKYKLEQLIKSIIRAAKKERKTWRGYIWDYLD